MKRLSEALASRTLAVLTVTLVLGILFVPLAAETQQAEKVHRIGFLSAATNADPAVDGFRQGSPRAWLR